MTHGLGGAIALSGMVNPIRTEESTTTTTVAATAPSACNVLLVYPRFAGETFWNFAAACEIFGAKYPTSPLGLITVAAMLPSAWTMRLVDRNVEELGDSDLEWADLVMTGGMLPQHDDLLEIINLCRARGKPVAIGGPGATSVRTRPIRTCRASRSWDARHSIGDFARQGRPGEGPGKAAGVNVR